MKGKRCFPDQMNIQTVCEPFKDNTALGLQWVKFHSLS